MWAEKNDYKYQPLDLVNGDVAGIKIGYYPEW
jgi:protein subunit release factor B